MRRLHLRDRGNILKRLLIHIGGCNLALLMRKVMGVGTPKALQDLAKALQRLLLVLQSRFAALGHLFNLLSASPAQSPYLDLSDPHSRRLFRLCVLKGSSSTGCYAYTLRDAGKLRRQFIARYQDPFPKAVKTLDRDWDRMLTLFDFPKPHWRHLRTTNVVESPFEAAI